MAATNPISLNDNLRTLPADRTVRRAEQLGSSTLPLSLRSLVHRLLECLSTHAHVFCRSCTHVHRHPRHLS